MTKVSKVGQAKKYAVAQKLMGCNFELAIKSDDATFARTQLQLGMEKIKYLENMLSEFLPEADTYRVNEEGSLRSIPIQEETYLLIDRCLKISALTQGYFDISAAALKGIYAFKNTSFKMPNKAVIKNALRSVGYEKIQLNENERNVSFIERGMKISFAAVGKGYASDVVKKVWIKNGVKAGYINASGDMNVFNTMDTSAWNVAIAHPDKRNTPLLNVPLQNFSIATSGDYEQHFIYNKTRYSHNINPITGMPITGVKSVSVFSPSAELSDALATAVYAMGIRKGIGFIDQLPQTHCIIVDLKNKIYLSKKVKLRGDQAILN